MVDVCSIYCCECGKEVNARLTNGREVYPHRPDLFKIPIWKCDTCKNFVGCHHKTDTPTKPLGVIANQEIKNARMEIHRVLDVLWKSKLYSRGDVYRMLKEKLGHEYHTAEIKSLEEVKRVLTAIKEIKDAI